MIPTSPQAVIKLLQKQSAPDLAELLALWRGRDTRWHQYRELYRLLGSTVIRMGEPLVGYDIVTEGLSSNPDDLQLRELQALALLRSGAPDRAAAVLEPLRRRESATPDTLGLLGRVYKDLADRERSGSRRQLMRLRLAADAYLAAFRLNGDYWTGINAATTVLLLRREKLAQSLAAELIATCKRKFARRRKERYWLAATIGEALLIRRSWSDALQWYREASQLAESRFGDIHSTRRNARLILRYWGNADPTIEAALRTPAVVVFSGHMIDSAGRRQPRFPATREASVAKALSERLDLLDARIGYSSAANGADILFIEAMIMRRAEVTIVLPTDPGTFCRDSVSPAGGTWRQRFERVLQAVSRIVIASPTASNSSPTLLRYTNDLLLGLATIRARQFDSRPVGLAVWDGQRGDGEGGTAGAIRSWRRRELQLEVIDPRSREIDTSHAATRSPNRMRARRQRSAMHIMTLLFADAVGFSRLTEDQVSIFARRVLGRIAALARISSGLVARNTWGDGLFFVFKDTRSAVDFSLTLSELVEATDWGRFGLPHDLSMRIGLHAGPVYAFTDPIVGHKSFSGTHVSRAARIEPVTPPGHVYASEAFACLAVAEGINRVAFDYVGQMPMAKNYGSFPTYHVRRL